MKKVFAFILFATATTAFAACPIYAPYGCTAGPNGKMICGCGK